MKSITHLTKKETFDLIRDLQREKLKLKVQQQRQSESAIMNKRKEEREIAEKERFKRERQRRISDQADAVIALEEKIEQLRAKNPKRDPRAYIDVFDGIKGSDMTIDIYKDIYIEKEQAGFIQWLKRKRQTPRITEMIQEYLKVTRVWGILPKDQSKRAIHAIDEYEDLKLLRETLMAIDDPKGLIEITTIMMIILKLDKDKKVTSFLRGKLYEFIDEDDVEKMRPREREIYWRKQYFDEHREAVLDTMIRLPREEANRSRFYKMRYLNNDRSFIASDDDTPYEYEGGIEKKDTKIKANRGGDAKGDDLSLLDEDIDEYVVGKAAGAQLRQPSSSSLRRHDDYEISEVSEVSDEDEDEDEDEEDTVQQREHAMSIARRRRTN